MVLKCKLQKTVRPALVEKSEKVVAGLFQSISFLNGSQLFFLVSFLGILGVLIWFVQPTSQEESEESKSSESSKEKTTTSEDEEKNNKSKLEQQQQQSDASIKKRKVIRQIDTIFENANETAPIDDESHKKAETKLQTQTSPKRAIQQINITADPLKSIDESLSNLIATLTTQQQQQQQPINSDEKSDQKKVNDLKLIKVKRSLEDDLEPTADPDDMVDQFLNDLIVDDNEKYAYNKEDKKNKSDADISSIRTGSSNLSNQSRNSLLDMLNAKHVSAIEDHFKSLSEISVAIQAAGLERSQLIFGIDFTISNLENGLLTFNGRSLHYYDENIRNPYQKVIEILGKTLECFDVDGRIPAYGFGDLVTKDRKVFPFSSTGYCMGFKDVLEKYNEIVKTITLSGPTNFAPLIKEAIRIVKDTKEYHVLVIVADGQVTNERQTRNAIVEASKHALSIIMVGVGDGPWDTMKEFDDSLPKRQFDNFQFVNYHEVTENSDKPDEAFALNALMEIPDQYKAIKELGFLKEFETKK